MLATTSRYQSEKLRELSKALSVVFSGEYVSRGKKKFDDLVEYARKKGHSRICIVSSDGIDFAIVNELGSWKWMDERIIVKNSKFVLSELEEGRELDGENSALVSKLFGFRTNEQSDENVVCNGSSLLFPADGSKLKLEVSYERQVQHND